MNASVALELTSQLPVGHAPDHTLADLEDYAGRSLPADFRAILSAHDGAEGWIGDDYLALWPASDIIANNQALEVRPYLPDLLLFATDGGGEAYAFRVSAWSVVRVPLVGMAEVTIEDVAPSLTSMLERMARDDHDGPRRGRGTIPSGHVVYEVQPVRLGGSATDSANKAIVPLATALAMARWWNGQIRSRAPAPKSEAG